MDAFYKIAAVKEIVRCKTAVSEEWIRRMLIDATPDYFDAAVSANNHLRAMSRLKPPAGATGDALREHAKRLSKRETAISTLNENPYLNPPRLQLKERQLQFPEMYPNVAKPNVRPIYSTAYEGQRILDSWAPRTGFSDVY